MMTIARGRTQKSSRRQRAAGKPECRASKILHLDSTSRPSRGLTARGCRPRGLVKAQMQSSEKRPNIVSVLTCTPGYGELGSLPPRLERGSTGARPTHTNNRPSERVRLFVSPPARAENRLETGLFRESRITGKK